MSWPVITECPGSMLEDIPVTLTRNVVTPLRRKRHARRKQVLVGGTQHTHRILINAQELRSRFKAARGALTGAAFNRDVYPVAAKEEKGD